MKIEELINSGESLHLEIKEAQNGLPKSIWTTYSAFANTDGGTILLGVKENLNEKNPENRFEITGIDNVDKIQSDFWNTLNNPEKVSFNTLNGKEIEVIEFDNKKIIKIDIPVASYQEKPVYLNGNPYSGTYLRSYEGDYRANKNIVNAMIRDSYDSGNDSELIKGFTFDDIDQETLKHYQNEFKKFHIDHIWNGLDQEEFLENLGGIAKDRLTGKKWLTNAGLLMFGKGLSIREYFDSLQLDYLDQRNLVAGQRWSKRINIDGNWENNLFNFIKLVLPQLTQDLDNPFNLPDDFQRIDDSNTRKAIREALINMIIHSDYQVMGALKIIKKDNALFFSNPGNLKLPLEEIFHGGFSKARNPKIQKMLELIGYGESIGSGFTTILKTWKDHNWRVPDLNYNEVLNQVELKLWMIPVISSELDKSLKQAYSKSYSNLNEIQKKILISCSVENGVTRTRIKEVLGINNLELNDNLNDLVQKDYLNVNKYHGKEIFNINLKKIKQEKIPEVIYDYRVPLISESSKKKDSELKILKYLQNNNFITNKTVLEITNISSRQGAHKVLTRLVNKGILTKRKEGKTSIYSLN